MNKSIRKQRRQGSLDGDGVDSQPGPDREAGDDFRGRGRVGHPGTRRENNGWQPANHVEHEEQFISRIPSGKVGSFKQSAIQHDSQGKIVPGKGVQRRSPDQHDHLVTRGVSKNLEHQPALAHVVSRQNQGMTGSPAVTEIPKGLDAFSMGDIRQAEKLIESGRMGLDEYARKIASGELNRAYTGENHGSGGFFADDDDGAVGSRPWLGSSLSVNRVTPQQANVPPRIVPGTFAQKPAVSPPPPPSFPAPRTLADIEGSRAASAAAPDTGRESNASGLALLQMLVDRKASTLMAKSNLSGGNGPRQLTQQQINELIAMSKRAAPKNPVSGPSSQAKNVAHQVFKPSIQPATSETRSQIVPGAQSRAMEKQPTASAPKPAPPHVALLLEQLHRQQVAQQQSSGQVQAAAAQPAECQQQ